MSMPYSTLHRLHMHYKAAYVIVVSTKSLVYHCMSVKQNIWLLSQKYRIRRKENCAVKQN